MLLYSTSQREVLKLVVLSVTFLCLGHRGNSTKLFTKERARQSGVGCYFDDQLNETIACCVL
jgi:hypothetical protein